MLTTFGIVFSLLFESLRFFNMVSPFEFLFGMQWSPQTAIRADQAGSSGAFGAVPLFWGTIFIGAIIAMAVAIPLGLMSAIWLTQYAPPKLRTILKPVLEILAGVQTCSEKSFAALDQVVIEHSALVSGCICILLAWDEARQQLVRKLESLGVPLLVLLVREANAPALPPPPIATTTRLHEIPLDQITESLAKL